MRNMSFALTTEQFLNGTKTVTRRLGWTFLKPGDHVCAVRKSMGLKKGEKVERLGVIEIERVTRERLIEIYDWYGDCKKEGFPEMRPSQFVEMFCKHNKCEPTTEITRIEFKRIS